MLNHAGWAARLPKISIPDTWKECRRDSDCVRVGDACRSCGNLFVINSKYKETFEQMDKQMRLMHNFFASCEACSDKDLKISCQKRKCEYKRGP